MSRSIIIRNIGVIRHEPCPKCRSIGRDTRGDNLVVYPDGHKYCFSCLFWYPSPLRTRLTRSDKCDKGSGVLALPEDATSHLGVEAAAWLRRYGITRSEIENNTIMWSPSRELLIFPIYAEGHLIAWQGRNFKRETEELWGYGDDGVKIKYGTKEVPPKQKYLTFGQVRDIMHIIEPAIPKWADLLVVVEGVLDAIKVGRVAPCMPLFGSHMPLEMIIRASKRFSRVALWLDSDKTPEAVRTAVRASQYLPATVVATTLDPKEYHETGIEGYLNDALKEPVPTGNNT